MRRRLRKILSGLLEEVAIRLIGMAMLALWLLALGLAGGCISLLASQSYVILLTAVAALALALPLLVLWQYLQKEAP
ncbi:hypothetical protein [Microvirga sp. TS319]|uniref:hypothetical protein n=1 Tax=Microvirga sp. TS319 TaxID=3241165 RepID=UPI00351AA673